ncbi:transcription elongation factor A protein 2 isoform X2 [Bombina bombina]|uniref:transcription elongation factor A protein 2 isoform X2 n=1 Tax=Bombina bombina TaxID=8345 RepID=UPI00235AC8C2|nr:transcription elongation factor A protein 2 isoform X2 [Bombina bombina]
MGSEEELLKIGRRLERRMSEGSMDRVLELLRELQKFNITIPLLRSTKIGVTVNKVKKKSSEEPEVEELAKTLIKDWKRLLDASYKDKSAAPNSKLTSPPHGGSDRLHSLTTKKQHADKHSKYPETSPQTQSQQTTPDSSKPKSKCPESSPRPESHQTVPDNLKLKRSHSTDIKPLSTTKKTERRHSLNLPLPSSPSKSSSNTKEERNSLGSPASGNGSSNPASDHRDDSRGNLSPLPVCSSPPSCFLPPCYQTGDSVRDKCVEMVTAALKTDDDYKEFGANCERIAWEIEESIYNEMKITDMKYRNRIRSRISNLKDPKNPNLRRNVLCGVVTPQRIAVMTAEEMASDELKELRNILTKEAIREHQMAKTGGTQTDLLQCDKCKKKNCTYNQVQTRSADEPMTTFVLCNECGNRWKFC